jgi:hypothetical protein
MMRIIVALSMLLSVNAFAAGEYCASSLSLCKPGQIIVLSGDDIARSCDFEKTIAVLRTVHQKPTKDGISISVNIVACIFNGNI